ncbi:streptococcal hemagglutinin-like [Mangifera indica]|uniref:streptococcal hemagglutinin-like n=1 Tax=Mangifera indica TaxID=29780 RepID=UPI001CFB8CD2|nr:streptococcal hemagglutinin-like [Mangifera indica]
MMNRSRNIPAGMQFHSYHHHGRGQSLTGGLSKDVSDENQLDLFSKSRRTISIASSDDSSDVSVKLGRLSVGSAKLARSGMDDLLSSTEGGKHDYDWLLTPPGTPLFPSSDGSESQPNPVAPRSSSLARSVSTTKASRLSVSQSESNHSTRPARSSSLTRSSVSSSQYSNYSSNRGPSILNTSSASISSYTRAASPSTRSVSRPSTPSSRPTASRSSTPCRTSPSLTSSSIDRTRPTQNSRPSTPSSRPQIPANLNSTASRPNSRPSTPTRRNPVSSTNPSVGPSTSAARVMSNGRTSGPASRPSSPGPRVRPPQQPVVPPDFPLDTPPNLRTTLPPDRPVSAGRSRPGSVIVKGNPESTGSVNMSRRHSSPIVTRGRLIEPPGRSRSLSNGHADILESRKTAHISELSMRKPVKPSSTVPESTGFGRTISKKSLDMAIRHMDIRNGSGSIRQLSGTTLFPQSIRSAPSKTYSARALESVNINGGLQNGGVSGRGNSISRTAENGNDANDGRYSAKLSEVDIYESSRYDALLLKEDLKNTNWLHSIDDKSDQGLIFDNGLDPLPEPFGLL